jgi:hypothetical protein
MENGKQPAAPTPEFSNAHGVLEIYGYTNGLSKREWYAGLAMQSMIEPEHPYSETFLTDAIAKKAIRMADALLKALEEPNN